VPVNDGREHLLPPVRTVDVAWPERGGEAVAVLVEDEEGMIADRLEVTIVGRLLLRAMDRTLRAVDVEGHAPAAIMLHQISIQPREPLIVSLLRAGPSRTSGASR
jgi:uracil phosphoribosyltransferase